MGAIAVGKGALNGGRPAKAVDIGAFGLADESCVNAASKTRIRL